MRVAQIYLHLVHPQRIQIATLPPITITTTAIIILMLALPFGIDKGKAYPLFVIGQALSWWILSAKIKIDLPERNIIKITNQCK